MVNDSKSSVLCSEPVNVASIDGQMNCCGDGQFNEFVSNIIITNVEVSASVPQVLCDENYSLADSSVCLDMSTHIAPQYSLPPGTWPVTQMETVQGASTEFDNALLSRHNNANMLYNVDRFNYWLFDTLNNADFYYVYIHNFPLNKPGGFYYLRCCHISGQITVQPPTSEAGV